MAWCVWRSAAGRLHGTFGAELLRKSGKDADFFRNLTYSPTSFFFIPFVPLPPTLLTQVCRSHLFHGFRQKPKKLDKKTLR